MEFKIGDFARIKELSDIPRDYVLKDSELEFMKHNAGRNVKIQDIISGQLVVVSGVCIRIDLLKAMDENEIKPEWPVSSLIHAQSLVPLVKVLEYGARKYAPYNWQKPMNKKEILDSMARHLMSVIDGEENDPESGLNHMGHIMANAMFYVYHSNPKE